jgi:RNA polymerase sigma-B factor
MSRENLDDLDELATIYADAWTAATAARRGRLRNDLICRCLPFASRMARRYAGRGEPFEDLQQVARIGLINAVDRYDPGRGSFTALAHHLDVSAEQIRHARLCGAGYTPVPLSTPTGNDGSLDLGDALGDPDPDLEILTDKLAATELVHLLPQRIQRMLALRFFGNLTQAQIAAEFNISQMQVSRLLARGLAWLRAAMLSDAPPPWIAGENVLYPDGHTDPDRPLRGRHDGRVSGEVDRDTADQLRLALHAAVVAATDGCLVIDVSGMPLADAAAVAVLRDALRAAALAHVEVTLTAVQPHVAPVIATLGLA